MNTIFKKSMITLSTSLLLLGSSVVMAKSVTTDHRTGSVTHDHRTTNVVQTNNRVFRAKLEKPHKVKVTRVPPPVSGFSELEIPVSILTSLVKSQFNGIKIHLNNYGKRHGNSWYKGGDSYMKLPPSLGNNKYTFSLPAINKFPFRYYVNNINLSSFNIGTDKGRLVAKFNLEENGIEVKGRCAGGGAKGVICKVRGSDKAAPDIHMSKATASVYLTPAVRNESLSFGKITTDFTANIRIGKTCGILKKLKFGGVCSSVEKEIKHGVKTAMYKSLNNNTIRDAIAVALKKELSKYGVKKMLSAKIKGKMLMVRFRS